MRVRILGKVLRIYKRISGGQGACGHIVGKHELLGFDRYVMGATNIVLSQTFLVYEFNPGSGMAYPASK
jgi:hypothetical protein